MDKINFIDVTQHCIYCFIILQMILITTSFHYVNLSNQYLNYSLRCYMSFFDQKQRFPKGKRKKASRRQQNRFLVLYLNQLATFCCLEIKHMRNFEREMTLENITFWAVPGIQIPGLTWKLVSRVTLSWKSSSSPKKEMTPRRINL